VILPARGERFILHEERNVFALAHGPIVDMLRTKENHDADHVREASRVPQAA
jgi:hypothetical protein